MNTSWPPEAPTDEEYGNVINPNRHKDLRDEFAIAYVNIVLAGKDIPIWDELWNDAYDFADHGMKARGK